MLSAFMGMIFLFSGHGVSAGINLFKSLAEYSYNAAKFFYYQSKSFGKWIFLSIETPIHWI